MMNRIFSCGELIIDMVGTDQKNLKDGKIFEKNAGGAPANVCAAASKLGGDTYFMGQVGEDNFGEYLISVLNNFKIDTSMVVRGGNTTMAFVSVDSEGERDFAFLRDSDAQYDFRNIKTDMISSHDILHFGSAMALIGGNLKKTYLNLYYFAEEKHCFKSFDPNYRDTLLSASALPQYKKDCITFIKKADMVKISEDELHILADCDDAYEGAKILNDLGSRVVIVTMGKNGALLSMEGQQVVIPSIEVKTIDTTGAGDAFIGAVLYQVSLIEEKRHISFEKWQEIVRFANVVGALLTTKYGAMEGLPTLEEVQNYLK